MTRLVIVCPCCQVPFTRTIAGRDVGAVPRVLCGWYYDTAKADWCVECRLGVRWFPRVAVSKMWEQP